MHVEGYIFLVDFYDEPTVLRSSFTRKRREEKVFSCDRKNRIRIFPGSLTREERKRREKEDNCIDSIIPVAWNVIFPPRRLLEFSLLVPTLVNYPRLPPRLITSSNVRGWSRNFAGNVADGVQRGEVSKRQGE